MVFPLEKELVISQTDFDKLNILSGKHTAGDKRRIDEVAAAKLAGAKLLALLPHDHQDCM